VRDVGPRAVILFHPAHPILLCAVQQYPTFLLVPSNRYSGPSPPYNPAKGPAPRGAGFDRPITQCL